MDIATETFAETADEIELLSKIATVLFPRGTKREKRKMMWKLSSMSQIRCDSDYRIGASRRQPGGILGNREKLGSLGIKVMRDFEAVELVKHEIIKRDEIAREISLTSNIPLPCLGWQRPRDP